MEGQYPVIHIKFIEASKDEALSKEFSSIRASIPLYI